VATTDLLRTAKERTWYHTIELPDGTATNGWFDLRPYIHHYGLPDDMSGMRVLEVGCWDGFWSFEMERRGAEVVAIDLDREEDLDWPPRRRPKQYSSERRGDGFRLLKELKDSKVERVDLSVYRATPEEIGMFDMVFCGVVLLHLRDQLLALERIASVCSGTFITAEEYDRLSGFVPFPVSRYFADRDAAVVYWLPSIKTWKKMLWTAGFDRIEQRSKFVCKTTDGKVKVPHVVHHAHKS
jgi:tRNA (mo5U34)-methyltransferase